MNDIIQHDGGREIAAASASQFGLPMEQRVSLLREALTNPDVDPAKASAMAELMFKMEDRDRESAFIEAKTAAISAMPRIGQDGYNTHLKSKYAKWETMQPIVNRVLTRHGLALSFVVGGDVGKLTVRPVLQGHGWTERGEAMPLPSDTGPGRSAVQAVGSAISYGKRYAAMAMMNILQAGTASEDDDGAGGGTAEDRMTNDQRALIDASRSAAMQGSEAYNTWFKALEPAAKGWLAYEPYHQQNKDAAAVADRGAQ